MPSAIHSPYIDYRAVFQTLPRACLLLGADPVFTILDVNQAHLDMTKSKLPEILGKPLFEVFPNHPTDTASQSASRLRSSLNRVLKSRSRDVLPAQKFDIRRPDGNFEERYWSSINVPVLNAEGQIFAIIHQVEDVTEYVRIQHQDVEREKFSESLKSRNTQIANHKLALSEEHGQEREAIFRSFFDSAPVMMGIVEVTANDILHLSDNFHAAQFFGKHPKDLENRWATELGVPDESTQEWIKYYQRAEAELKPVQFEYWHKVGNVERFFVVTVSFIVRVSKDRSRFSYIFQDQTEMKRAQMAVQRVQSELEARVEDRTRTLFEREQEFQTLANFIPQLAWMADSTGWIYWYNQRWFDYTGTSLEQMQGWGWKQVHHPNEVERVERKFREALASDGPWEDTFPLRSRTGEWRWFLSRATPIKDRSGKIVRWFGTNTDITEQRRSLEEREKLIAELEFEKSRFEAVMKQMPAAVIIGEAPSGKLVFANERHNEVWRQSLIQSNTVEEYGEWIAFHPDGSRYRGEDWPLARSITQGEIVTNEVTKILRGDGTLGYLRLSSAPVRDRAGKILAGVVICQDVTDSVEAERVLRETQDRLTLALESAAMGIFDWHWVSGNLYWSDTLKRLWGYKPGEFSGQIAGFRERIHFEDLACVDQALEDAFSGKKTYDMEYRVVWPDGSVHWIYARGRVYRSEDGKPIRMLGSALDVTLRKELEVQIRRSEEQFRIIFNLATVGLAQLDPLTRRFINVNPTLSEITGYSKEELLTKTFFDLMYTEGCGPDVQEFQEMVDGRRSRSGIEKRCLRKDGKLIYVRMNALALRDSGGKVMNIVSIIQDISLQKQAEEVLLRSKDELEHLIAKRTQELIQSNRELESFSYSVSHDLRAPLRSIDGFSKKLLSRLSGKLDEQSQDYLTRVRMAAQRMGKLIDDLLSLSRISRTDLRLQNVDLCEVAKRVVSELQQGNPDRKVQFKIERCNPVVGDSGLLRIVLENLLGNAWKYTAKNEKAVIEFGSFLEGKAQVFYVKDNGAGFDMAYSDRLFGPFQRLHTEQEFEGTGIGLATVKRILGRHGGLIRAESKVGEGATFYFTLGTNMFLGGEMDERTHNIAS